MLVPEGILTMHALNQGLRLPLPFATFDDDNFSQSQQHPRDSTASGNEISAVFSFKHCGTRRLFSNEDFNYLSSWKIVCLVCVLD